MQAAASIDGVLSELDEARVPVRDRAFMYGDAVFEALRTYGGKPDALARHIARLERSAALLGITLPVSCDQLAHEVELAVEAVRAPERYVRIVITRGDSPEGLSPRG